MRASAFNDARTVEDRGNAVLLPFMERHGGRLVLTSKGTLARHFQRGYGDAIVQGPRREDRMWAVEIKCEERDQFGNLFLETWSNRNLEDRRSHAERGSNPGWLYHLRADLLLYYFIESDELYIISLFTLKRWAFGANGRGGRIYDFPERCQIKRDQLNDTWGRCVPIAVLRREIPHHIFKCNPLGLLPDNVISAGTAVMHGRNVA